MEEDLIQKAMKAAEKLEAANLKAEELLRKNEEFEAKRILGGHSEAGYKMPEMSQAEKDKAEMKAYFKGTSIESALK